MPEPRPIALFMPSPAVHHGGGAEFTMVAIANGLAQRGHRVDFLVNRAGHECWQRLDPDVRLHVLKSPRYVWLIPLLCYIRKHRPIAVLTSMRSSTVTALTAKRFITRKLRVFARQDYAMTAPVSPPSRVAMKAVQRLMPVADSIIALGEAMAQDLRQRAPKATIQVIPNPIDVDGIIEKSREPVEHAWFADDRETPVIVTATRLSSVKDLPTLLTAFRRVLEQRQARLVILGEGPQLESLNALAAKLDMSDAVDFPGFDTNPFRYMARADAYALTSITEGFGNAVVEAMACGTTVVSTDCPYGPPEILDNGTFGYLAPVGDAEQVAQQLLKALDNPIDPAILQKEARRYGQAAVIDAYEQVLGLQGETS